MSQGNGNGSGNVRVDIYDQTYHLRGSDTEYIAQLAEYVDNKMRLIAQQASTVDSLRVAVLAALTIADDPFARQSDVERASFDAELTLSDETRPSKPGKQTGRKRMQRASRPNAPKTFGSRAR